MYVKVMTHLYITTVKRHEMIISNHSAAKPFETALVKTFERSVVVHSHMLIHLHLWVIYNTANITCAYDLWFLFRMRTFDVFMKSCIMFIVWQAERTFKSLCSMNKHVMPHFEHVLINFFANFACDFFQSVSWI